MVACAIDSATGECHARTGFVCFLVAEAEPRVQCEMLFEVPYGRGDYATELARLCREYGVTGTSSSNYRVQGCSGKDFTLHFYEQPQVEPDPDKTDFPLSVFPLYGLPVDAEETDPGAGTFEGRMATIEEAQLQAALAASVLDVRSDLRLTHEVRPRLPSSPGLKLHEGWRAVRWVGVV